MFVLYALNNGLSCPEFLFKSRSSQRSQGRSYKPLAARQDEEQDESDEEVDPQARRMMELSSLGSQERPSVDSHEYAESKQPQNQRAFPMHANTGKKALPKRDEGLNPPEETDAVELQRELELFAQDDNEEDAGLLGANENEEDEEIQQY